MDGFKNWLSEILESLFTSSKDENNPGYSCIWLAGLYLGGIILWVFFFNGGNFQLNFQDWYTLSGPRLTFLKDAVTQGLLPLHISGNSYMFEFTDRYLSIPDTILAPQALLLRFLSVQQYVVVNQLLMYSIGFAGLLWFKRKFSLSIIPFIALFLLFNFNGHVLAHFAVGHETWTGYFLFPWFAVLIFQLLDGRDSWVWVAELSGLLFLMFLQGSFHQFVWSLLFLGILGLFSWKRFWPVVNAGVFSIVLSMVRILPPSVEIQHFPNYSYIGYPTVTNIFQAMVTLVHPGQSSPSVGINSPLGWWEYDLYLGLIGVFFILFFGVYRWLKSSRRPGHYGELVFPIAGMVLFSIGMVFSLVRRLPLTLLDGERVASRMISLAFVFLAILAAIELQRWLSSRRFSSLGQLGLLTLLAAGSYDLYQNYSIWRVSVAGAIYSQTSFQPQLWHVVVHPDPVYLMMVAWGLAISLLGLLLLALLIVLEKKHILVEIPASTAQKSDLWIDRALYPWLCQAKKAIKRLWSTVSRDEKG